MEITELRDQRGRAVKALMSEKGFSLPALARKVYKKKADAITFRYRLAHYLPTAKGTIRAKTPIPVDMCIAIATACGVQASTLYVELMKGESEQQVAPAAALTSAPRSRKRKSGNSKPTVTISIPKFGMVDVTVPDSDIDFVSYRGGFALKVVYRLTAAQVRSALLG